MTLVFCSIVQVLKFAPMRIVPSPTTGSYSDMLSSVTAISPTNVWAVGNETRTSTSSPNQTLIEHWNGTKWSVVPSPNPGTQYNYLSGVTAISPTNIWAVGIYTNANISDTLIEHWNGTTWSIIPGANPGSWSSALTSVTRIPGSHQLWAVGTMVNGDHQISSTLIERWDGIQWSVVSSPNPGRENGLTAVVAISAKNACCD